MSTKKKVCIDYGHGGPSSPGACLGTRKEADDVYNLGIIVTKLLRASGISVIETRGKNQGISIMDRCKKANNAKVDYLLSIHRNSAKGKATGIEIWIYSGASDTSNSYKWAKNIIDECHAVSGQVLRGPGNKGVCKGAPSYQDFGVNKYTNMPAALLELGFISNPSDNADYDKNMNKYAEAIARAICENLNVRFGPEVVEDAKPTTTTKPSTSTTAKKEIYRVRKTWKDAKSQIGAYYDLLNAKKACKPGYAVFNSQGKVMFKIDPAEVKAMVRKFQNAAIADGLKKHLPSGTDGIWGKECESVAAMCLVYKRAIGYKYKNLTRVAQEILGFTGSDIDGKFGKDSRAKTIAFQKAEGLAQNGIWNLNTWKAGLKIR